MGGMGIRGVNGVIFSVVVLFGRDRSGIHMGG